MSPRPQLDVQVSRSFDVPAERVFDAWLDPEMIGQWMFGPSLQDEKVLNITVDPKVGGAFSFLVRRQGTEIDHVGKYREIDRPSRLVFTWGIAGESEGESLVIIVIVPAPEGCELTLTHEMDPKWVEYADRTREGWTKMFKALSELFE